MIGGIVGGVVAAGFLVFLLMRGRIKRGPSYDARFLIVPSPKTSTGEEDKGVYYILSEGRVIRITPHRDDTAKS